MSMIRLGAIPCRRLPRGLESAKLLEFSRMPFHFRRIDGLDGNGALGPVPSGEHGHETGEQDQRATRVANT